MVYDMNILEYFIGLLYKTLDNNDACGKQSVTYQLLAQIGLGIVPRRLSYLLATWHTLQFYSECTDSHQKYWLSPAAASRPRSTADNTPSVPVPILLRSLITGEVIVPFSVK